jgi:cytochrome c'
MKWIALSLSTVLAGGLACATTGTTAKSPDTAAKTTASAPPGPPPKLRAPDYLPVQAREILFGRMQRHGEEMMYLTAMVLTLNHEGAAHLADHIAEEPRIGRPRPEEHGTISELLPERFFDLQDELNDRAKDMASAARTGANDKMVQAYGRLTQTCVSCHEAYLADDDATGEESGAFEGELDGAEQESIERE